MTYQIDKADLFRWCKIPADELAGHPDSKVQVRMHEDKQEVFRHIADLMAEELIQNNQRGVRTKWVLPAGPMDQYEYLIGRVNREKISLKNLWVFHMDEFLDWQTRPFPVADTYESLEGTMLHRFYHKIDPELTVPDEQRIWPRVADLDAMDKKVQELGGVDTVWAGVGYKGLVAFCEAPRSPYYSITEDEYAQSKTRVVHLNDDTLVALSQRSWGGLSEAVPPMAVTIGFKSMLTAKRAVFMITTGDWKKTIVRIIMFSEPTVEYPVTLFPKYIPEVILFCDRNTAQPPHRGQSKLV